MALGAALHHVHSQNNDEAPVLGLHGGRKRILNVHIFISYPFTYPRLPLKRGRGFCQTQMTKTSTTSVQSCECRSVLENFRLTEYLFIAGCTLGNF